MAESDFVSTVTIDGELYSVFLDPDYDGMIGYFQLRDAEGNFFFEIDWVAGSLSEDEIRELVAEDQARNAPTPTEPTLDSSDEEAKRIAQEHQDLAVIVAYAEDDYLREHGTISGSAQAVAAAIQAAGFTRSSSVASADSAIDEEYEENS